MDASTIAARNVLLDSFKHMFARSRTYQDRVRLGEFETFLETCAVVAWHLASKEHGVAQDEVTLGDVIGFIAPFDLSTVETRVFRPALNMLRRRTA